MARLIIRRVSGDSMLPNFKHGDLIIAIKRRDYDLGKVVVADLGERQVIKRVCYIKRGEYFLEGDNRYKTTDYKVGRDKIVGQVIWSM